MIQSKHLETEITDIEPYLTLVSPSETETLAITCNEDTENLEIDKPSIIELPEGCTGIINNHKIYGHPWNSEDRVIKHYNELTPEVDEDEDLMFQDEDDDLPYSNKDQNKQNHPMAL